MFTTTTTLTTIGKQAAFSRPGAPLASPLGAIRSLKRPLEHVPHYEPRMRGAAQRLGHSAGIRQCLGQRNENTAHARGVRLKLSLRIYLYSLFTLNSIVFKAYLPSLSGVGRDYLV